MIRRIAIIAAAAILAGAVPAAADTDSLPYAAMRTLQSLQEQIAHGNATAQAAQPKLMEHIADGFLAASPAVWHDPRNARAAVLFLLSGGRPSIIRSILGCTIFPSDIDRLLKGALAYGEGQDDIARKLLEPVDPQSLPTAIGGHLALIKANLVADRDAAKATKLFDTARLLAPGTLIEETALRREVFLLSDAGTIDKALLLARQYVRRFRTSSYAGNFTQRFDALATKLGTVGDVAVMAKFDSVLSELPSGEARSFYLAAGKAALINGKTDAARFAAQKGLGLAGKGSADESRAKLYLGASAVVSEDPAAAIAALKAIDASGLSPEDASLREAALSIGAAIRADSSDSGNADPGTPNGDPVQTTIDHARAVIATSTQVLQEGHP